MGAGATKSARPDLILPTVYASKFCLSGSLAFLVRIALDTMLKSVQLG
jgi:hypothetical protein